MSDSIPAKHVARLAVLTNTSPNALVRMFENSKEQSAWMKGRLWIGKQTGLISVSKKTEGIAESVSACFNKLVEHIRKRENICQEGLFRKSGSVSRQCSLKLALQEGGQVDGSAYTAHDCTAVLKTILADLPEPLLTRRLCRIYAFVHGNVRLKDKKIEAMGILMSLLPASSCSIARSLFCLLHDVAMHCDDTKMTPSNLATIFAPHVMCPRQMTPSELLLASHKAQSCVAFLVEHAYSIFKVESMVDLANVPKQEAGRSTSSSALSVTAKRRSSGEKRRHSDHGVTSELARGISTSQYSPKRRSEHERGFFPNFEITPVVRLVRLNASTLMASPFSRRDGAVSLAHSSERPSADSISLVQHAPPAQCDARPSAASFQDTTVVDEAKRSTAKPPKPLPRRLQVSNAPKPTPRKNAMMKS